MQLLSSNLKIIKRLSIEEIVQIARTLMDEVPSIRDHVGKNGDRNSPTNNLPDFNSPPHLQHVPKSPELDKITLQQMLGPE